MDKIEKILPVSILVTTFNRRELLKKCIQTINERTFFPYRIIVIDSGSTDGTQGILKQFKVEGKIFDAVLLSENVGQCKALNAGFQVVEAWENNKERMYRPSNDFIITTQDDCYPPMLGQENCWLTQMIDILERNEPEYGGLAMRIQRTPRTDIDEKSDIIPAYKNFPGVFRLMRRSDIRKVGDNPFGTLFKWQSNITGENYKNQIRKKFGFCTALFSDHAGFMLEKKGYPDLNTYTVADNKLNERNDKPYPDIDPLMNVPIKVNHSCDTKEFILRENYQKAVSGEHVGNEVTLVVLTCKRPDGIKRILNSIKEKTKDVNYDLVVIADNDDVLAYQHCLENGIKCILSSERRDFVRQANLGIYTCETPLFCVLADDMKIVQDGWLGEAIKTFKERFPDGNGLMSFDEGLQHGRIFTTGLSSKKFVSEMGGNLYFPLYYHAKADREVTEIARSLNLYHYAENIKVEHFHPTNPDISKRNEKDATYIDGERNLRFDRDLYNNRKQSDLSKKRNYCDYLPIHK